MSRALVASTVLLAATCLITFPSAAQETVPTVIRVVCDDNYPPYVFRDARGVLQGILVDRWAAWEEATGVEVVFDAMDWAQAQAVLAAGQADVIDTVFKTPERERAMDFGQPYAEIEVAVYLHESISGIASPEDLRGFRVAVKEGDACIDVLRAHGVEHLVPYPSYAAIVDAVEAGRERVFCMDAPPALYLLSKADMVDQYRKAFSLYTGYLHRAVAKGDSATLALVERGFATMPQARYNEIDRRWFGSALASKPDPRIFYSLAAIAGVAALVAANLGIHSVALRRRVAEKTSQLADKVRQLEASEKRTGAMLRALPDIMLVFDGAGRVVENLTSDPSALYVQPPSFLGKTLEETLGDSVLHRALLERVGTVLGEGSVQTLEYSLAYPDGDRYYEARLVPLETDRVLSVSRDITDRVVSGRRIAEDLREKEALLKEIHHRVKNNLQIVSSLLSIQSSRLRDERDREVLAESQGRIRAMAQVHDQLYRSRTFSAVPAAEYLTDIMGDLETIYANPRTPVRASVECDGSQLDLDVAVPIGLIVNELATNAFKYAFRNRPAGRLTVSARTEEDGTLAVRVRDDGAGLPDGFDMERSDGMGFTIVKALAQQLKAALKVGRAEGGGVEAELRVPPPAASAGDRFKAAP